MPHRATLYKQRATFYLTVPQRTIALTRLLNYIELLYIARYGFEEHYLGEDNGDYGFVAENSRDLKSLL